MIVTDILEKIKSSKDGDNFTKIMEGKWRGKWDKRYSQFWLTKKLAWWCNKDHDLMREIFIQSEFYKEMEEESNADEKTNELIELAITRMGDKEGYIGSRNNTVDSSVEDDEIGQVVPWPDNLEPEALYGLAGEVVRAISPYTEADEAALLINLLVAFGNVVGSGPYFKVGEDRHGANLFAVLVGQTSKGRKGTSWSPIKSLFARIDEKWALEKTQGGLSSGEGVIWMVRDPIVQKQPTKEKGKVTGYQDVIIDHGVSDKRHLIIEGEFANALKVMTREGNNLSPVIRSAWDSGNLATLTKNSPAKATNAHISVIGHITKVELLQRLTETEKANGFANRFLFVCVRRSKLLPDGYSIPPETLDDLEKKIGKAYCFAKQVNYFGWKTLDDHGKDKKTDHQLYRDVEANNFWCEIYPELSKERNGLVGAILGRAEAQVIRIAMIYALLDQTSTIIVNHLKAAMAVWKRCEQSVMYIFGNLEGDEIADHILEELKNGPMTQTQIYGVFNRNVHGRILNDALQRLSASGKIRKEVVQSGGRPATRWLLA